LPTPTRRSNFSQTGGSVIASDWEGRSVTPVKPGTREKKKQTKEKAHAEKSDKAEGELRSSIPFPGYFRPGKSSFWFQDEWEEKRFVEIIKALPERSAIKIIGRSTEEEAEGGKGSLGLSRAWSVFNYLVRQGIEENRMSLLEGDAVKGIEDLDKNGRSRNRWVSVIIEDGS
jgi:hypothetical protein